MEMCVKTQNCLVQRIMFSVFKLGVGITIAIRSSQHSNRKLFYYRVPELWRKTEKTKLSNRIKVISLGIDWQELIPDAQKYLGYRVAYIQSLPRFSQ